MYSASTITAIKNSGTTKRQFDIWHEVPLVPQLTGMSCWAAAAAMLVGWRDCINTRPDAIARASGHWQAYREGLEPHSIHALCHHWHLHPVDTRFLNTESLRRLLYEKGPLWIGEASPGLHSIVIVGIYGDGTEQGTYARINDPWPLGHGERYSKTLHELFRDINIATHNVGRHIQVLHSGGRSGDKPVISSSHETLYNDHALFTPRLERAKNPTLRNYGTPFQSTQDALTLGDSIFYHRRTQNLPNNRDKSTSFSPVFVLWPGRQQSRFVVDFILVEMDYAENVSTETCLEQCRLINNFNSKPKIISIIRPLTAEASNRLKSKFIHTFRSHSGIEAVYWQTMNWLRRNTNLFSCLPGIWVENFYLHRCRYTYLKKSRDLPQLYATPRKE